MDPRRLLILAAAGALLSGCAVFRPDPSPLLSSTPQPPIEAVVAAVDMPPAPLAEAGPDLPVWSGRPYAEAAEADETPQPLVEPITGRRAIAAANAAARAESRADGFVGGVQVFAWSPGRVYEVWTAPLRVTTLSLAPGETLVAKAAGDTVRWQIGEAASGTGSNQRTHILLKPLERGLETNLVLTTNRRVYLIDLKSGAADAFNPAVAWDEGIGLEEQAAASAAATEGPEIAPGVAMPVGDLDGRYRIEPQGRRARWTPTSVFNDGLRTFITFDPDLQVDEAPVLFVIAADGEAQLVNYRQVGGLFVVDRVFDQAELRLGDRRPQVVRIRRITGGRS